MLVGMASMLGTPAHAQTRSDGDVVDSARTALAPAREALDQHDYGRALSLANAWLAQRPSDREGHVVAGLATFRQGDYAAALEHFDVAIAGGVTSASLALGFNRGSCLYSLGRMEEAERAFLATAAARGAAEEDVQLAVVALLNAGFAALELGALERARLHLTQLQALDTERAFAAHAAELAAEIEVHAAADASPVPRGSGNEPMTTAATAAAARNQATEPDGAVGLSRIGPGFGASLTLGGGYDGNATQSDLRVSGLLAAAQEGGAFGRMQGVVLHGHAWTDQLFMLVQYDVEQLAYAPSELDAYAAQEHALELALEGRTGGGVRLGGALRGRVAWSGLRDMQLFDAGAGGELNASVTYAQRLQTALFAAAMRDEVVLEGLEFLTSTRLEVGLVQRYRSSSFHAAMSARYVDDGSGTHRVETEPSLACVRCSATYVVPFGYRGASLSVVGSQRIARWLRAALRADVQWRFYRHPSYIEEMRPLVITRSNSASERMLRWGVGTEWIADLSDALSLELGYRVSAAHSNLELATRSYTRHVVELAITADF
jgi:tetratricopeptide (TPR) repeat protein